MKQPHFKYYWERCNENVIIANLRDNSARRVGNHGNPPTMFAANEWFDMLGKKENGSQGFPITRAQYREFVKTGVAPKFSFLNKWSAKA